MQASEWIDGDYGGRLRRARQRIGLSQAKLAQKIGADQSKISRAETGVVPHEPVRTSLADFVNSAVPEDEASADAIAEKLSRSPELKALIRRIMDERNA